MLAAVSRGLEGVASSDAGCRPVSGRVSPRVAGGGWRPAGGGQPPAHCLFAPALPRGTNSTRHRFVSLRFILRHACFWHLTSCKSLNIFYSYFLSFHVFSPQPCLPLTCEWVLLFSMFFFLWAFFEYNSYSMSLPSFHIKIVLRCLESGLWWLPAGTRTGRDLLSAPSESLSICSAQAPPDPGCQQ